MKISTLVIALLLGASLALAQTGGDKSSLNPQPLPPGKKATTTTKTKKGHKGGKEVQEELRRDHHTSPEITASEVST